MVHLNDPNWLFLALLIPVIYWLARRRRRPVNFSTVGMHKNISGANWISIVQAAFIYCGLASLVVALAQPQLFLNVEKPSIEARDFVLLIDTSDSMEWGMIDPTISDGLAEGAKPSILTNTRKQNIVKRIHAAEASIQEFLSQRDGDRVGFIIFDKQAYYGWPLTDDLKVIKHFVAGLPRYVGAGTEFDGRKGAIQAALNHFADRGQAKTKVIVMVTDGEGDIAQDRISKIAATMKDRGVKLYVIGIGYKKWEDVPETEDLRSLVQASNGKIIEVLDVEQMRQAFEEINQLEKSTVTKEDSVEQTDIAHWFIILGLALLMGFVLCTAVTHDDT